LIKAKQRVSALRGGQPDGLGVNKVGCGRISLRRASLRGNITLVGSGIREMSVKIGAKVVTHGRYVAFQMSEVAVSRQMFADILTLIAQLRAPARE
jgi:hypothetical protein